MEEGNINKQEQRVQLGRVTILLSVLALVSSILTIIFDLNDAQNGLYILKPLSTILIILIAVVATQPPSARYKQAIIIGLIFSLGGDVILILPGDVFIFGLISFLIAHLFYIAAFINVGGFYRSLRSGFAFLIVGILLAIFLWPDMGEMRAPALIYMFVILVMAWQALGQWRQTGETRALLAFIGALLFVISDLALAINRFANPIEMAALVVLGTYYPAQWLIALSVGHKHP